jgi:hypothetical protein
MPALIVRNKIVPLNAKIEGPYIGLAVRLNRGPDRDGSDEGLQPIPAHWQ